jgi:hypothetical protein
VRRLTKATVGLVFGLAIAGACSDRKTLEEEPDREALCSESCKQFLGPCNPWPPQPSDGALTQEQCMTECVADQAWDGACRFKYADKVECSNDLSCEEFGVHQTNAVNDPCLEAENAWSSCL